MNDSSPAVLLRCAEPACLKTYPLEKADYACPDCGGLLDVDYRFTLPAGPEAVREVFAKRRLEPGAQNRSGVWRFRELIPFVSDLSQIVTLQEGNTPIYEGGGSGAFARLGYIAFKHQGMNPTGSFKDNGMTAGVTRARQVGAQAVACASTGNTSASMAAYAARAQMRAIVFIPAGQVALGKLSQALEYGADVVEIDGNFDDAMRIVRELADETGIYLLNSVNPFRLEGQKTIVIEMMEQLGWSPPDWIVLPGGNLGNVSAFGKGLHEMLTLGLINRAPRLAVIQASGAAPLYELFTSPDRDALVPVARPATLATAIRIGNPVSWRKAVRALEWTRGLVEQVTENEIADAKAVIGRDGIGCEPASAVTLAGVKKLVAAGTIMPEHRVVCVLTGNLLKDPGYTIEYHTGQLSLQTNGEVIRIVTARANEPQRVAADKTEIKNLLRI
ncbi:MAG TPA: threonine synthase [Blastocatellia bacterium]